MEEEIIIGIGDLHGHYPALKSLLEALQKRYSIFNGKQLRGGVKLRFTGDYIDRGESNLGVLDKIIESSHDSNIVELFGNHELMALASLGYAREIVNENLHLENYFYTLHGSNGGFNFIQEFSKDEENALRTYVSAMDKTAALGKWMRSLKPFQLDSFGKERILFAHGGIPNDLKMAGDLEEYSKYFNQKIQMDTLEQGGYMKKYFENTAMGRHSIFWDRTMIALPEKDLASKLKNLGITRVVVGHTPHHEIINYYNLAFDIDVGMTPKCGRNMPAALVFKKDGIFAFYVNGVEKKLSEIDFA